MLLRTHIAAEQDRYERAQLNGQKGGRPKILSGVDEQAIAAWRREGYTAVQIGDILGVDEKLYVKFGQNGKNRILPKMGKIPKFGKNYFPKMGKSRNSRETGKSGKTLM